MSERAGMRAIIHGRVQGIFFQWDVTVVRKIVNPDGSTTGEDIGPTSETRVFYWR